MSNHQITTSSAEQRQKWVDIFGSDVLPVKSPYPVEKHVQGRGMVFFYTLDPKRMRPMQLHRLAAHITARVWHTDYASTLARITENGYDIDATHCRLLETADQKRPSLSVWQRVAGGAGLRQPSY
jgi:hypothetical protein